VAGGHTIDDPVPKYGLAVVGLADPGRLMTIDRAAPGDQLILTKAIGTGVIATALKRGAAPPEALAAAVASMTLLNAGASQAALAAGVRAATDVTGFGLLGHLHRMLAASGAAARINAASVPLLPGAAELAGAGFVSGGTRANTERMRGFAVLDAVVPAELAVLLHDAQTSRGLLLAAPGGAAPERRCGSDALGSAELHDRERLVRAPWHATDAEDLRALCAGRELALLGCSDPREHTRHERVLHAADVQRRAAAQGRVDLLLVVGDGRVSVVVLPALPIGRAVPDVHPERACAERRARPHEASAPDRLHLVNALDRHVRHRNLPFVARCRRG